MFDKEVLLAIINGPGTGLTLMVIAFIGACVMVYCVRLANKGDFERGKEAARKEGLEQVNSTLARLVSDQADMKQKIDWKPVSTDYEGELIVRGE